MDTPDEVTGPINLGNPAEFRILDLAGMVIELTGSRSQIVYRPLPEDDPPQRRPDISEAQRLLGWRPTVALKGGPWNDDFIFRELVGEGNKAFGPSYRLVRFSPTRSSPVKAALFSIRNIGSLCVYRS